MEVNTFFVSCNYIVDVLSEQTHVFSNVQPVLRPNCARVASNPVHSVFVCIIIVLMTILNEQKERFDW